MSSGFNGKKRKIIIICAVIAAAAAVAAFLFVRSVFPGRGAASSTNSETVSQTVTQTQGETTALPEVTAPQTALPEVTASETTSGTAASASSATDAPATAETTTAPTTAVTTTAAASAAETVTSAAVTTVQAVTESTGARAPAQTPTVYFTSDISPEGLLKIYKKLGFAPSGKVAVKLTTGEPPASNYLKPELIGDLVRSVDGTIVECNTAYGGARSVTAMHKQVAKDHGYTDIATFDLMDEKGDVEWPVTGGKRLDKIYVGSHAENYDDWIILSHFKGHMMAGYGGAIKNVGIGISSQRGKIYVHSAGTRTFGTIMHSDQDAWLEALAEMVLGFSSRVGREHIVYINVMNRLSVDCDCVGMPASPDIHDIGIAAGTDPVAVDQACIDMIYRAPGNTALVNRIESLHGLHTLEHAEEIGLGSRTYDLVDIDG